MANDRVQREIRVLLREAKRATDQILGDDELAPLTKVVSMGTLYATALEEIGKAVGYTEFNNRLRELSESPFANRNAG